MMTYKNRISNLNLFCKILYEAQRPQCTEAETLRLAELRRRLRDDYNFSSSDLSQEKSQEKQGAQVNQPVQTDQNDHHTITPPKTTNTNVYVAN